MALSFCYNLGSSSLRSRISADSYINFPPTQTELDSSFLFDSDYDNSLMSLSDNSIDSLFDTNVMDHSTAFLPSLYSTAEHSLVSLAPQKPYVINFLDEEARHPKRQKITASENNHCRFTYASEFLNVAFVPNPSWREVNIFRSSQAVVLNACGNLEMKSDNMKRGNSSCGSSGTTAVSTQSIAAREMRRKMTYGEVSVAWKADSWWKQDEHY